MQRLSEDIIKEAKRQRIKKLEGELSEILSTASHHEMIICPLCHYTSDKGRGSAKVFVQDDGTRAFKCFSCGVWRAI